MSISTDDFTQFFDHLNFDAPAVSRFRGIVLSWYADNRREMPWRETRDPWAVLVSELMLQQTRTERVLPKYIEWMNRFPDAASLADSPLDEILRMWNGLGYNRRALALARTARILVESFGGIVPDDQEELKSLPGVGRYTAAAVAAFAFGQPSVVIETNVRSVFLHHFFPGEKGVADRDLEPIVIASLDRTDPRNWYYALMDYGVELKRRFGNPSRRSASHARQPPFADSNRRLRGGILRALVDGHSLTAGELGRELPFSDERIHIALGELAAEGFIDYEAGSATLATKMANSRSFR